VTKEGRAQREGNIEAQKLYDTNLLRNPSWVSHDIIEMEGGRIGIPPSGSAPKRGSPVCRRGKQVKGSRLESGKGLKKKGGKGGRSPGDNPCKASGVSRKKKRREICLEFPLSPSSQG